MKRKKKNNKHKIIGMFIRGDTYLEISKKLDINISTVKSCIYRNAPHEVVKRKEEFIKSITSKYKNGKNFREIASELNIKEDRVRKIVHKHIPKEVKSRKVPKLKYLSSKDIKELEDEKRNILRGKGMKNDTFFKWNRQSYITVESKTFKFDRKRGIATKDVPRVYKNKKF